MTALQVLLSAAAAMTALLALLPAAGHDQLWFLLMGERWLHGAVLYGPTLFDSNPPPIVWISAVPVWVGQHSGLAATAVGKLLVLGVEGVSASLSLWFLRRLWPEAGRGRVLWLAFGFVCLFGVVPARDFGQRDHLTAILCLPYVLAAALDDRVPGDGVVRRRATAPRVLAGVIAGAGICLKPHQVLVPVAVEAGRLWLLGRRPGAQVRAGLRGLLRPEPGVIAGIGVVLVLLIRIDAPAYFTLALPTLRDTYWAIGGLGPIELLREAAQLHVLGIAAVAVHLAAGRRGGKLRDAATLLLVAGGAATVAYYVQGTGWYYQQLPGIGFFGSALLLDFPEAPMVAGFCGRRWVRRASTVLAVVAVVLTAHFSGYPFTPERSFPISSPDPSLFRGVAPGTPVATITTSVDDAMMPVARYHLFWAQRTNNVWTLPAILRTEDPQGGGTPWHRIAPERLGELEQQQHRWMVEDLERWRPRLILVARCQAAEVHCQELEDRHDDLLAWFKRDPEFCAVWAHYRFVRSSGEYDAYARVD